MSLQAITTALAYRGLSPSEKLIVIGWANYADEAFRCYPSQRRLSEDTGLSDRQIRRLASDLEDRGLIHRLERRRPDGSRSSDLITLLCLQADTMSGGVRTPCPGGGDTMSGHNLLSNHSGSKEPKDTKKASRRCPKEWTPNELDTSVGKKEGLDSGDIQRCLQMFRDHTFGTSRSDWSATFRNWLRKAGDQKRRDGRFTGSNFKPSGQKPVTSDMSQELQERLAAIKANRN